MDFENEKNFEEKPVAEQNAGGREGYQQADNGFQRDYRGRSPRPRIHSGQRPGFNGGERPNYNRKNSDENGFRPEGFGAALQGGQQQEGYRPRSGYNNNGGYQPRQQGGGYQPRQQQGGYQSRQQGGGYQPRQQGGYNNGGRPYGNSSY